MKIERSIGDRSQIWSIVYLLIERLRHVDAQLRKRAGEVAIY